MIERAESAFDNARELARDDTIFSPTQNYTLRMIINQIEAAMRANDEDEKQ